MPSLHTSADAVTRAREILFFCFVFFTKEMFSFKSGTFNKASKFIDKQNKRIPFCFVFLFFCLVRCFEYKDDWTMGLKHKLTVMNVHHSIEYRFGYTCHVIMVLCGGRMREMEDMGRQRDARRISTGTVQ